MRLGCVGADRLALEHHCDIASILKCLLCARLSSMNHRVSSSAHGAGSSRSAWASPSTDCTDIPARPAILRMGVLSEMNITNTFLTPHILARRSSLCIKLVPIL